MATYGTSKAFRPIKLLIPTAYRRLHLLHHMFTRARTGKIALVEKKANSLYRPDSAASIQL